MSVQREYDRMIEMEDNIGFDKYPLKEFDQIGKENVRRLDGKEKASGRAEYTIDVQLPGMLYLKFLTSPYPHAAVKEIDMSKAEALTGVRGFLMYEYPELPELAGTAPRPSRRYPTWPTLKGSPLARPWWRIRKPLPKKRSG